jgi:hypothetical protein
MAARWPPAYHFVLPRLLAQHRRPTSAARIERNPWENDRMQRYLVSALCLTAGLLWFAGASLAQNIDPDRVPSTVDAQQREACTPDVMRLCNNYVPDIPQIVACLKRERQNLSPACALVFATPEPEPAPAPAKKASAKKAPAKKPAEKKKPQ